MTTTKKVESFKLILETEEDFTLLDILTSDEVMMKDKRISGKDVSYRILSNKPNYIVGLLETSKNDNIPPKRNRKSKKISELGLSSDEGLAYANVFLFEKKRNIIMYEVNKNGCPINHFIDYLEKCLMHSETFENFNLTHTTILTTNAYQKIKDLRYRKSVEIEIANPTALLKDYKHKNDSLFNLCSTASEMNHDTVKATFSVYVKDNPLGLASDAVAQFLDRALSLVGLNNKAHLETLKVVGYEPDGTKQEPIDLIAQRYLKEFTLQEPRQNSDLLEIPRTQKITELYTKSVKDFDTIFGK